MTATPNGAENGSSSFLEAETVNGEQTVIIDTTVTRSGGSSDSSSPVVESAKLNDDVSLIKEDDVDINAVSEFNDPPSVGLPKAMEIGPTPFLRKTYEIVDEAVTDPVVSWSSNKNSFIIWDPYEFSEILLPKYFKHNNFSSFIRQLSTYGFRKVDSDRWEFANEGFQKGSKDLLKNIKRRSKANCDKKTSTPVLETVTEVETLKKEQSSMRLEMLKLKNEQEESHHQMVTVQEKIQGVESKQQHMLTFFARLAKDQRLVERLIRKRKLKQQSQREIEAAEFVKKLKFLQDQETKEKLPDVKNDQIVREKLDMAGATQPNLEFDVMMNNESENMRC